jgi:hypothetical protein
VYLAVDLINFVSALFGLLISFPFNVRISQPYKNDGYITHNLN